MAEQLTGNLSGKIAVVTGATSRGIGREVARNLARLGAEVILPARSVDRGNAAREDIVGTTSSAKIEVMPLDLSSMTAVRSFAEEVTRRYPQVSILVNNAAMWTTERQETPEGNEVILATNVLGPYLLCNSLIDSLKAGAPSRIVNVVSQQASGLDIDDLQWKRRKFSGFYSYGQSKQCMRMLTWGLAERLAGSGVTVNAVEPGFVRTELNRSATGFMAALINVSASLIAKRPEQGADAISWAASSPELANAHGKLFSSKRKEVSCPHRDPAAITALERKLDDLVGGRGVGSHAA